MPITQSDLPYHFYSAYHPDSNHHATNTNTNTSNKNFATSQFAYYNRIPCSQYPFYRGKERRPAIMAQMSAAELENFQDLSDHYHAELPGPLVSEKLQMDILVKEYSQADSTFIRKTTGLAATHSGYRAVKGDGQCGWRSTVFRYFELLVENGDAEFVQLEKLRLESFKETMLMVGLDYDILQDMFDSTWELFDAILQTVRSGARDTTVVLNILNDPTKSDFIVYHFKSMTSAFMRLRSDDYAPFLEMTVDEYCMTRIDPAQQEIDQIGLQALTDAVISQAGFGLEVLYLDRSSGDEVTPHSFTQSNQALPVIRLLYRPGHYDIIYKGVEPIRVFLQHAHIPQHIDVATFDPSQDPMGYLFPPEQQAGSDYEWNPHYSMSGNYNCPQYQHSYQPQPYYSAYEVPQAPPPIEIPAQPMQPQKSPRNNTRASIGSSRSGTLSPSPINASEPQIRFHPSMTKMDRFSGVPISATPSR